MKLKYEVSEYNLHKSQFQLLRQLYVFLFWDIFIILRSWFSSKCFTLEVYVCMCMYNNIKNRIQDSIWGKNNNVRQHKYISPSQFLTPSPLKPAGHLHLTPPSSCPWSNGNLCHSSVSIIDLQTMQSKVSTFQELSNY